MGGEFKEIRDRNTEKTLVVREMSKRDQATKVAASSPFKCIRCQIKNATARVAGSCSGDRVAQSGTK
jgi:hypothetical protein